MMPDGPETYWNDAGVLGYGEAMFKSSLVERHVNHRLWGIATEIGRSLGLDNTARVLDLGCGDGAFANQVLAVQFAAVDGLDQSPAGIARAEANAPGPQVRFCCCDITRLDFTDLPRYDGVFLIGILHHVKSAVPDLLQGLRNITDRVVVLEPNGNHLLRRLLELTPAYRAAGEASFGHRRLIHLFEAAGYRCVTWRRLNLFPNFTPPSLFRALRPFEPAIEANPLLRALCTVDMYGFDAVDGSG
jgi:SAM-dependent methyltransferase